MALTWNISNCEKWEELVCDSVPSKNGGEEYAEGSTGEQMNADRITNWIVFRTMDIGMNEITEKNVDEFYRRIEALQELKPENRVYLLTGDPDGNWDFERTSVSMADVVRRIGLYTNASEITKSAFDGLVKKEKERR